METNEAYRFHPAVESDFDAIADYYLSQDSPKVARRVTDAIFDMIESLVPFEVRHRGHRRFDLTDRPLLFISVYDYLVAYAPNENPMYIIAILHGRRDPRVLTSLLNART